MQEFIDRLGKAAQQTANETKLRLAIRTLGGKLDDRAQALGHLMFRRQEGETVAEEDLLKILKEMSEIKAERQAREAELEALHKAPAEAPAAEQSAAPAETPAPAPEAPAAPVEPAVSQEAPSAPAPSDVQQQA